MCNAIIIVQNILGIVCCCFFKLNVPFNELDYWYLDFMCIQCLWENMYPLKAFRQNGNINVAGNDTTVIKHTNNEYSTKKAYMKSRDAYTTIIYIEIFIRTWYNTASYFYTK